MIKTHSKLGIEGNFLKLIKSIFRITIANMYLLDEIFESFLLWSEIRQGYLLLQVLFSIILSVLGSIIKIKNEGYGNWKRKIKTITVCTWYYRVLIIQKNLQKLLGLESKYSRVALFKINMQNLLHFYIPLVNRKWKLF